MAKVRKVREGDTHTIKVRVSRVSDEGDRVTVFVVGQPVTAGVDQLNIIKLEKVPSWAEQLAPDPFPDNHLRSFRSAGRVLVVRIVGNNGDRIDRASVTEFFRLRAEKNSVVGPISAVIYQDKKPELAIQRDASEKALLGAKLKLRPGLRMLDLGCGNGRWAEKIVGEGCHYLGTDFSPELIAIAQERFASLSGARFQTIPIEEVTLPALSETTGFDRVTFFGVMLYLNDEDVLAFAQNLPTLTATSGRIVFREPLGTEHRLTILEHHSEDMDQTYNAIYRTEADLLSVLMPPLERAGFSLIESGDVFPAALNNRPDTKQRYFVIER